jgi:hypothetical protein
MSISSIGGYNVYMQFMSRSFETNGNNRFQPLSAASNTGTNLSLDELRAGGILPQLDKNSWLRQFDSTQLNYTELLKGSEPQGNMSYNAENFEDVLKSWIEDAMNITGIDIQNIEDIEIALNESWQLTASGLKNDSDNQKLTETLNHIVSTISPLSGGNKVLSASSDTPWVKTRMQSYVQRMFYRYTEYAMSAADEFERDNRATLIDMKNNAAKITKSYTGIDLDFSRLYRTEDGKIAGYPEELSWYFEADITIPTNSYQESKLTEEEKHALVIRNYANRLLDAGCDNIPSVDDLNVVFKFDKSDFVRSNINVLV